MDHFAQLLDRFASGDATVGVIGLGYVGLPLAAAMHDGGFRVIGFDVDPRKIDALRAGETYLKHLGDQLARTLAESGRFEATGDMKRLAECHAVCVCVPTPLGPHLEPDLSYVLGAAADIGAAVAPGKLIVLESTTYPTTTRDEFLPALLNAAGARGIELHVGADLFVAFSPEREDPGNPGHTTQTTPKLVGGLDDRSTQLAAAMYSRAVGRVVPVSSAEVAESAKLLENVFRAVNIALVNELKVILDTMGIDVWEVIDAAATKPFGFMPFRPGPGLGGHCIPIDPYYLSWKAREAGVATRFIELAGEVNRLMPRYVVDRVAHALNEDRKALHGSSVLVLGIAYKKNIDDVRETPAAEIIRLLSERGAKVCYHDPHVPEFPAMRRYRFDLRSAPLDDRALAAADCVLIVTDHDAVDYDAVGRSARLIVDTRNAMARARSAAARIVKA